MDAEFEELKDEQYKTFCELGCGVGNALFPILDKNPHLTLYGFDFAKTAIALIQNSPLYKEDKMQVAVCDLVKDSIPAFPAPDLASLIFVLSAIAPEYHVSVMQKVFDFLKPGSILYFR